MILKLKGELKYLDAHVYKWLVLWNTQVLHITFGTNHPHIVYAMVFVYVVIFNHDNELIMIHIVYSIEYVMSNVLEYI